MALKNLRGLAARKRIGAFKARSTHRWLSELIENPTAGRLDTTHLTAIHRYMFQDVFGSAGEFRTLHICKGGHLFGRAAFLEPDLQQTPSKACESCLLVLICIMQQTI